MDASTAPAPSPRIVRPAWFWGGVCLAATVLPGLLSQAMLGVALSRALGYVGEVLWCAAFVLFALGRDSTVARRGLGIVALCALGAWPLVAGAAVPALPIFSNNDPRDFAGAVLTSVTIGLIPAILALVAVVQVWRADALPRAFRWAPTAALVLCVIPDAVQYMPFVFVSPTVASAVLSVLVLCRVVALVGLGVVAIVAGMQPRTVAPVSVYSSSGSDGPQ